MAARAPSSELVMAVAAAFDIAFYRAVHTDLPERLGSVTHYCGKGWREGRDPAPWFSVADYLAANPDVQKARVEPFSHYLLRGRYEGRETAPSRRRFAYYRQVDWSPKLAAQPPASVATVRQAGALSTASISLSDQRRAVASEFDANYYLVAQPDVARAGGSPLDHFMNAGWREDRDPHPGFSVRDYLESNPDVAQSGLNPFAHFVIAGRAEGRAPRYQLGFRQDLIAGSRPLQSRIRDAALQTRRATLSSPAKLAAGLRGAVTGLGRLHLTFSHDDYVAHAGGVQFCLRRESERVRDMGYDHVHLFPAVPWPTVRTTDEPGALGVLLNGRALGAYSPEVVRRALLAARGLSNRAGGGLAIHSLLGHAVEETLAILQAAGLTEGYFWLHDFTSLCAGFHLLRDDVEDCAAPPPTSAACNVCSYGPHRARHLEAHRRLFEGLSLTVVAPAQTTLDLWQARSGLPAAATRVAPHGWLTPRGVTASATADSPFRVAFLGMPTALKGWAIFKDLAEAFAEDSRYAFVHLGGRADPSARVDFHAVALSEDQPRAMQDMIEALAVDAAVIWPLCRETFSFTAYEAAAAGAAVITGPDSGNVAAFASTDGRGVVLPDEASLMAAFASGDIRKLSRAHRRAQTYDLVYSGMTGDLLAEAAA